MKLFACIATVASVALTGCVSPLVRPNAIATQYRATNAVDWQSLAARTVASIPTSQGGGGTTIFIAENPRESRFYAIYRGYLEQELYRQNYHVLRTSVGAGLVLETHTDWLLHDRAGKKITDYASLTTTAVGYFGQMRHISSLDTGFAAAMGTGVIFDFLAAMNGTTKAEVVVTSKLISLPTNDIHFVRSEAIYVEPTELTDYMDALPLVAMPLVQAHNEVGGQ